MYLVSPENACLKEMFFEGYHCRGWAGPAVSVLSYNILDSVGQEAGEVTLFHQFSTQISQDDPFCPWRERDGGDGYHG